MLQSDVASVVRSKTCIVMRIFMVWLRWLSSLMPRIQIRMATTILMMMITDSDCVLSTIDSRSMDVAVMMSLIVIQKSKKLLIPFICKWISSWSAGVVLHKWIASSMRSLFLNLSIYSDHNLWRASAAMDVRTCVYIVSNALRPISCRTIRLRCYNIGMFSDLLVMSPAKWIQSYWNIKILHSIVARGGDRGGCETLDIRLQLLELLLMR